MSEQIASDIPRTDEAVLEGQSETEVQPEPEVSIGLLEEVADSEITDTLTKLPSESTDAEIPEDQSDLDKTTEDDSSELTNSRKSRELKSILALSKEAKLDTNLSRKRKTLEGLKSKESIITIQPESDSKKPIKVTQGHNIKFPVTAEAELEQDSQESADKASGDNSINPIKLKRKRDSLGEAIVGGATEDGHRKNRKRSAKELKMFKLNKDIFCWRCHREGVNVVCETCPRSYHQKCLKQTISDVEHWPCPECVAILKAESTHTRSEAMKGMSLEHLCSLLKFALNRMMVCQGSEPFLQPVSDAEFPDYQKYIIQPMDLTKLQNNIKGNYYGSTQAFEADAKWILHNSIIFNSYQSKLTYSAKNIIKICKQEMAEIENCPSCYLNANTKKATWFVEVCPQPHLLVWAKLKGFPYWPAKAMSSTSSGMIDVRFFGAHDRAWVHYKECFLYSKKDPNTFKQKRYDIEKCVEELNLYIDNLKKAYGDFRYAPYRTPLDPHNMGKQMLISIPKSLTKRRRSLKSENAAADDIKTEPKSEENDLQEDEKTLRQISSEDQTPPSEENENTNELETDLRSEETKKDYPCSEPYSNRTTPAHELDTTMEGYGTDDDSVAEIDLERRKAFAGRNNAKMDDDDEDDTDTQVPSNVSVDGNVSKGGLKARSGSGCIAGKTKVVQRRKSELENSQKRVSSEEAFPGQRKTSRRNSDLSVKSDSSLLSNFSEKINRVDISENMEISLGNEDITISDNVSPTNGETSKSSSECSFEHKRKPVQVDINNAEFTISPSNKLKISDQLMKRLSDANEKVEEVKKSVFEKKSSLDKHEKVHQQEDDISRPSTSDGKNPEEHSSSNHVGVEKKVPEKNGDNFNETTVVKSVDALSTKRALEKEEKAVDGEGVVARKDEMESGRYTVTEKAAIENDEGTVEEYETIESEEVIVPEKKTMESEGETVSEKDVVETEIEKETEKVKENDVKLAREKTPDLLAKKVIQPAITEFTSTLKPTIEKLVANTDSEQVNIVESIQDEDESEKESVPNLQIDRKNIFNIIHSSLNRSKHKHKSGRDKTNKRKLEKLRIRFPDTKKSKHSKHIRSGVDMPKQTPAVGEIDVKSKDLPKSGKATKSDEPAATNNDNPVESPKSGAKVSETDKPKSLLKLTETPKSVLETGDKATTSETALKWKDTPRSYSKLPKTNEGLSTENIKPKSDSQILVIDHKTTKSPAAKVVPPPPSQANQKRRNSDGAPVPPLKIIKLVTIDGIAHQKGGESLVLPKTIAPNVSSPLSAIEIVSEPVKSEPNSDDDFSENENLEAKRQYLSALNISEKISDSDANKTPEIRTRAKAEERREKFRKVDNLTKVIDDVALNYVPEGKLAKVPPKKPERRKSVGGAITPEGEIYVKSFAKLQTASGGKQRARKTFPTPSYVKAPVRIVVAPMKDSPPTVVTKKDNSTSILVAKKDNPNPMVIAKKDVPSFAKKPAVSTAQTSVLMPINKTYVNTFGTNSTPVLSTASAKNVQLSLASNLSDSNNAGASSNSDNNASSPVVNLVQAQKPVEGAVSNMTHVILMPTSTINYCTPLGNPFMNTQVAMTLPVATNNVPVQPLHPSTIKQPPAPNIRTSQNYVPQGDIRGLENSPEVQSSPPTGSHLLSDLLNQVVPIPTTDQPEQTENAAAAATATASDSTEVDGATDRGGTVVEPIQDEEFAVLNNIVPESVSRAVSDLLLRPPPRLRPRPPGILSTTFDEGIPSTAGDVTAKINSIAHRMTDYFRGMLIETLADLGKAANPESKIINLKAEIEALKHKHNLELSEMRQNICTILKDVQRSIVEDRERVKEESRAVCEAEAIKRIELAKSKQWCANCSKEAQFYCCWNTSYCDYPCQQKHWAQHMGKCTQNIEKTSNSAPSMSRPAGQPIILRPTAPPKPGVGRIMAKPTKVYLNRAASPQKVFKTVASSGNHITVIETTPGNYELLGNGPMTVPGTKFYSVGSNVFTKLKTTNSTPTSSTCPSGAASTAPRISHTSVGAPPASSSRGSYAPAMEED